MTTSDEGTVGPPSSPTGSAGLSFAWVTYRPGDNVRCPGTKDRRAQYRGDRRGESRPCPQNWGRAGEGTEVHIRLKPLHCGAEGPRGQLVTCPECHMSIQIKHVPAVSEAA